MRVLLSLLWPGVLGAQVFGASTLVRNADGSNDALAAVAKFDNCTGFAIRPAASTPTSAPAYLVTAGHCIDQSVTAVIRDRPLARIAIFRYFVDLPATRRWSVRAEQTVYSTMKGTDLAIVRLAATLGDLAGNGIRPLALSRATVAAGESVLSAGVPFDSLPQADQFLRTSDCTLGAEAEVVEWRWHWWSMWRNDCSDIRGGSSGSPLIARRTGEVLGVITTTNAGSTNITGDFRCFSNQPCEVVRGGFAYRPDTVYAASITGLAECFDDRGEFRLGGACPLDDGRQLTITSLPTAVQPGQAWNANITGTGWPMFRYKIVAEGEGDCRDANGYSAPVMVENGFRITTAVGTRIGRQYLCVVGTDGQLSQSPRFASLVHLRVDDSPPVVRPYYQLFGDERGSYSLQPFFVLPELGRFRYKVVAPGDPGCADLSGYREYLRIPVRFGGATERFCLIGYDEAENPTPPIDLPFQGVNFFAGGAVNAASNGALAPGSLMALYGTNLGSAPVTLTDAANHTHQLDVLYRGTLQINARVPPAAATGRAVIRHAGAEVTLVIEEVAPALFTRGATGFGEAIHETEGSSVLWIAGTGFRRTLNAEARISGVRLAATVVPFDGIDWVRIELPSGFRLRGLVPVQVRVDLTFSNTVWVRLP